MISVIIITAFLFTLVLRNKTGSMKVTSPAFKNNSKIPSKYTCDGENINPPLSFSNVPENAKSLALIVDDPDAPMGTWVHWVVFNIDPKIDEVSENNQPKGGIEGITSFGKTGYGGPCPPSGSHRYFFKLYAVSKVLSLASNADKPALEEAMKDNVLDKAEIIGLYSRKQ